MIHCKDCKWWIERTCRKHPPQVVRKAGHWGYGKYGARMGKQWFDGYSYTVWPETNPDDCCGEAEPKES